jgi:hypothetical protein
MPQVATFTPFIPGTGNPDTAYEATPYTAGQVGKPFPWGNMTYMEVQVHSGANATAAGQVAFWQDRANNVVTNVAANALLNAVATSNRNNVAGIFRGVIPAGSYGFIVTQGTGVPVLEAGAGAGGMQLVANTGTAADALGVAIGTPAPVQQIGVVTANFSGGKVTATINIT